MDLTLALSVLLPLLLILVFFFARGGKQGSRGDKLLVFGPVGSGKTSLCLQLRFGRTTPTLTSMQVTTARCTLQGEGDSCSVQLVDVPGSGRLRPQLVAEAAASAVLACVVDATQLSATSKEAAGMLFDVLALEQVERRSTPLLIVVNKSDARGAANSQAARAMLEAEVQKVRLARTTMQDTSNRSKRLSGIMDASGTFSFSQLDNAVEFIASSATQPELGALTCAIAKHMK